jgi:hypothetical protein
MAKRRTSKKPVRRRARKKDNSTIWILAALAAGVAYLMSRGTLNTGQPPQQQLSLPQDSSINSTSTGNVAPLTGIPGLFTQGFNLT